MSRDRAGQSSESWKKHNLIKVTQGQAYKYRVTHPLDRLVIIDMHASDGQGIQPPQLDLFYEALSKPTAEIAAEIATNVGASDLILCESKLAKRRQLQQRFPTAIILPNHARLKSLDFSAYDWALVFNDPCGPSQASLPIVEWIAQTIRSDFICAVNVGAVRRIKGVSSAQYVGQDIYGWMDNCQAWRVKLNRRFVAATPEVFGSPNFRYRVLVIANSLCTAIANQPDKWEVLQ